jgi:hypothetical protein
VALQRELESERAERLALQRQLEGASPRPGSTSAARSPVLLVGLQQYSRSLEAQLKELQARLQTAEKVFPFFFLFFWLVFGLSRTTLLLFKTMHRN